MSKARLTLPLAPWGAASSLEGNDVRPLAASLRTAPYSHFVPHLCVMGFFFFFFFFFFSIFLLADWVFSLSPSTLKKRRASVQL